MTSPASIWGGAAAGRPVDPEMERIKRANEELHRENDDLREVLRAALGMLTDLVPNLPRIMAIYEGLQNRLGDRHGTDFHERPTLTDLRSVDTTPSGLDVDDGPTDVVVVEDCPAPMLASVPQSEHPPDASKEPAPR